MFTSLSTGASTISDVSSSYMVGELDEGGKSSTYNLSGTPAVEVCQFVAPLKYVNPIAPRTATTIES